ncbi:MAG: hypothetical protein D6748_10265, partial [Calditrichaeota bacterium]
MVILPSWAPNVHPMLVHFPIAILIMAFLIDVLSLFFKDRDILGKISGVGYILGAIFVGIVFITGRQAADSVNIPIEANSAVSQHADWGLLTLWFFGVYGLLRALVIWRNYSQKKGVLLLLFLVSLPGLYLLYETAEHGAELVFRHGIGVHALEEVRSELEQLRYEQEALSGGIQEKSDGSVLWMVAPGAEVVLKKQFSWKKGSWDPAIIQVKKDSLLGDVLELMPSGKELFLTLNKPYSDVEVELQLNLDHFEGTFWVIHHFQQDVYDFIRIENGRMKLGRWIADGDRVEDEEDITVSGWFTIRAVGVGRHFRGYINNQLLTHGHAKPLP